MTRRRLRLGALFGTAVGLLLFIGLGVFFWRALPPMIPMSALEARTTRPFAGVQPIPSVIESPSLAGVRAAVITVPENARMSAPGRYARSVAAWEQLLADAGAELVTPAAAEVLVLPQARCLGPSHRRLIAAHLAAGRGLVTTGLTGSNDGQCTPLADTLLARLLSLRNADIGPAPRPGRAGPYMTALGESLLGAGLAPAPRINLTSAAQLAFRTPVRELLYTDYERHPLTLTGEYFNAAATRARVGPGRVAAFGFELIDADSGWSARNLHVIAANATRWAAGRPTYQLAPWPDGRKAAAVLSHDVEADFHNARQALEALAPYRLPGTAFIVGRLAAADPTTTRQLMAHMEIGSHTYNHNPLDTLTDDGQLRELTDSKQLTERLVGRPVVGMRPPEERWTPATLQYWADLGGTFVFANNDMRSGGPEIIPMLPDSLVLLGRVVSDDYELLVRDSIRDRGRMIDRIVSQVDQSVAYRSLYMFSYHSQVLSQKELLPVLTALARTLVESPQVWTTTAGNVSEWWRGRAAVSLAPALDGSSVSLTNTGRRAFRGGRLLIHPAAGGERWVELPVIEPGAAVTVAADGSMRSVVGLTPGGG